MAVIAVEDAKNGIANVTLVAANGGGDTVQGGFQAGGWSTGVILVVRNGHTSAQTVTVAGHPPIAVAANTGTAIIPVSGGGAPGTSKAVTYSGVTLLTIGAVDITGV